MSTSSSYDKHSFVTFHAKLTSPVEFCFTLCQKESKRFDGICAGAEVGSLAISGAAWVGALAGAAMVAGASEALVAGVAPIALRAIAGSVAALVAKEGRGAEYTLPPSLKKSTADGRYSF